MNRITKQVLYGGLYLGVIGLFGYTIYSATLRPAPTCTDSIQNRDEVEVDCGGRYCIACEIKRLRPISIAGVAVVPAPSRENSSILFEIRNPNAAYGVARFDYRINVYQGSSTTPLYEELGFAPVYPSETKSRLLVNVPVAYSKDLRVTAAPTKLYDWVSLTNLVRPKILTRDIRDAVSGRQGVVTGLVRNDNSFALKRVTINVFAYDASESLRAVSKTIAQDLTPLEERSFKATILLPVDADMIPGLHFRTVLEAER